MTPHPKKKHRRSKPSGKMPSHLDLIRQLPCILSGRPAEVAHIRYADGRYCKPETGIGIKPHDRWTLPLCPELHRLVDGCQHSTNEREWWKSFGLDPRLIASKLWGKNRTMMERVIAQHTPIKPAIVARIRDILEGAVK
ncbi:MAG: hypothetical protein ACRDHG_01225 [Anaerolineales bacterium]